jgi:hypothetical protein
MADRSRAMRQQEMDLARQVFLNTVDYNRVEVSEGLGFGDREWTLCGTSVYTIHMGPEGFVDCTQDAAYPHYPDHLRRTLIHELTHVWQGQNSPVGFGFMVGSVCAQASALATQGRTAAAYEYTAGKDWTDYNCEQQANIVEDWYRVGCSVFDARYRYIRDNIRSRNTGDVDPAPHSAGSSMQIDGPRTLAEGQSGHYKARPIGVPVGGSYQWYPNPSKDVDGLHAVQMGYDDLTVIATKSSGKAIIKVRYTHPDSEHNGLAEVYLGPKRR